MITSLSGNFSVLLVWLRNEARRWLLACRCVGPQLPVASSRPTRNAPMLHTTKADLVMLLPVDGVPQATWLSTRTFGHDELTVCKILHSNCLFAHNIALRNVLHWIEEDLIRRLDVAHV